MPESAGLPKNQRAVAILLCLVSGTAIGLAAYYSAVPLDIRLGLRLGLSAVFLAGFMVWRRQPAVRETLLAFWSVITGVLAAYFLSSWLKGLLAISVDDARGFAITKAVEVVPVILFILLPFVLRKQPMRELYLVGGRPVLSLLGGLGVAVLLFVYFISQGGWQVFRGGNLAALLPAIGWITVFSVLNALMEELWFRGLFLSRFTGLFGDRPAFWLTAVLFGLLHVFGSFTGTLGTAVLTGFTFLMGLAFGVIVRRTQSIWGAVLGHFFADFFMLLGYFATAG